MTTSEKIKEIIGGIFFIMFFFSLFGMTVFIEPVEQAIIEARMGK